MANSNSDRPSEFALIAELFAPLAKNAPGALGLLDDAALVAPPPGHELVVTADALVAGVHFLPGDPPDQIAKKALRVNLSDLAAKGAEPAGYLLALMLPATMDMAWLRQFAQGLGADQEEFGLSLLGGDTTATPGPLSIAITALGFVPAGKMIRRAGAAAGDCVFVSGTVGDAGAGLAILKGEAPQDNWLIARYRVPEPRLALGNALRGIATAGLDVSDGLLADLGHLAEVSKVRIAVMASAVPRSAALRAQTGDGVDAVVRAATAGDDYELAFTASAKNRAAVLEAAWLTGIAVSEIGRVEAGEGVVLLDQHRHEILVPRRGFTHF
ncbi:MAG: thiamine-phosphate kinase [Alphaproteobacteria bacterium]|nr:thiamine-phosphate kinase [Alphaproteobacteria bacterium]MDE2012472.1 thiamine-phosphate kinase [Alphaproteobacteria bacterium]MDE2074611.1 thiamine-phosphate kinase [Alphaproteobacteria bacterium]MDE2352515.1 thiamine-phosphate kinase [Alphaproteobacteria bacterium]